MNGVIDEQIIVRALLYQALSLAFYEPGEQLKYLEDVSNREHLLAASEAFLGAPGLETAQAILEAFDQPFVSREQALGDLAVEYNRLFVGPAGPVCSPYESVYDRRRPTDQQGTLLGPSAGAVCEAMRAEGLAIALDYAELTDHVAIELEFMYYLLSRAAQDCNDSYRQRADEFCSRHLASWLGDWGARVSQQAQQPFYCAVGRLLQQVMSAESPREYA